MLNQRRHPEPDFAHLIEPSPQILFRLDRALRHLYISPSVESVTGLAPFQFLGKTGRELGLAAKACDLFEAACHEVLVTGQERYLEFVDRGRRYRTRLVPQRALDGSLEGLIGMTEDITERTHLETALQALLAQKEALLEQKEWLIREANHRVKNSLQLVSSLLLLQSQGIRDATAREQLLEAYSRVLTVGKVHHQLCEQTKTPNRIAFDQCLRSLCADLLSAVLTEQQQIELVVEADPGELPTEHAVPLALMVNELVTNACKYAFGSLSQGTITITFRAPAQGWYALSVADSGRGLPDGFDPAKSNGLGLRLLRALTTQLCGHLTIEPADPGTRFIVTWPACPPVGT